MLLVLVGSLDARNRKGDKFLKLGEEAQARLDWDEALDYFEKALATAPADASYMLAVRRAKFQSAQKHVDEGRKLRSKGDLEAAIVEFQKAIASDPGSAIALQEWKRTSDMLEKEKVAGKAAAGERGLTPAAKARQEAEQRASTMMAPPELQPIIRVIPSLKMNNQPPKVLYETVAKLAGINVIFDPQYAPTTRNLNVEFPNSSIEQALDYLAVLTKTFWKPISSNTIFITEDNVTKRRDYEDNVVKVFYIQNATSVQEFQEISTAVRSLTEIRRVYTYNAQKAILMRGTPDQVALAEKLIHDLDKPKAEVVIDVIVMEANRSRTRTLASTIMSGGTSGLNLPFQFTPRNPVLTTGTSTGTTGTSGTTGTTGTTTTTSSGVSLSQLGHVGTNDFSTTLPGALLNLVMSDRSTKVLQSPQVRASDGQKVTLRIGDKIPFATGSFQPGVGAVGVSPLVSTQFNFAEVGVNVDITPQVHGSDEVTLKIAVEVSNVRDHVTIGGVDQPVIGQRKNETEIRLREGEVNILGGLSQASDSRNIGGIPGLVNLPILGRFLGGENTDRESGQLLIALIPHIVRTPNYSDADLRAVATGTDQTFKVNYSRPALTGSPAQAPAGPGTTPAAPPAVEAPKPAEPRPPIPGVPNPAAGARLLFQPPLVTTQLGGAITLTLQVEGVQDLFSIAPVRIKFDPKLLRLSDVTQGELMTRDGQRATLSRDIRNDAGEASVTVARLPGSAGINGTGVVASFTFMAIGKGSSTVSISEAGLKNPQSQPVAATTSDLTVNVQ